MTADTAVRERPILFSGLMVSAILSNGKTQTRRVVKPQPRFGHLGYQMIASDIATLCGPDYPDGDEDELRCPYGQPGDRLWVRERWRGFVGDIDDPLKLNYAADDAVRYIDPDSVQWERHEKALNWTWKPSIHMPRWASRITLEITNVRIERLQGISENDLRDEGFPMHVAWLTFLKCYRDSGERLSQLRGCFADSWDRLNAVRGFPWSSDPWVWAIGFKVSPAK